MAPVLYGTKSAWLGSAYRYRTMPLRPASCKEHLQRHHYGNPCRHASLVQFTRRHSNPPCDRGSATRTELSHLQGLAVDVPSCDPCFLLVQCLRGAAGLRRHHAGAAAAGDAPGYAQGHPGRKHACQAVTTGVPHVPACIVSEVSHAKGYWYVSVCSCHETGVLQERYYLALLLPARDLDSGKRGC